MLHSILKTPIERSFGGVNRTGRAVGGFRTRTVGRESIGQTYAIAWSVILLFQILPGDSLAAPPPKPGTILQAAQDALNRGQHDEAIRLAEPAAKDPSSPLDIKRIYVTALLRAGRPVDAWREYGRVEQQIGHDDEGLLAQVAIRFITVMLKDMREQMRGAGYTALKDLENDDVVPLMEDGLSDGSGLVRALAAEGLGRLKKGRMSPRFRQALSDEAAIVRTAVLKGLGRTGDKALVTTIEAYLKDEQPVVRVAAEGALVRLGQPGAIGRLHQSAQAPNPDERGAALRMLGELHDRQSKPILERALGDAQPSIRGAAASALSELGATESIRAIEGLLGDAIPAVRAAAAVSLGELGSTGSLQLLKKTLNDSNLGVRAAGIDGLLRIDANYGDVEPAIHGLMQHTDPAVRASIAKALGRVQPGSSGRAFEKLRVILQDPLPRPRIAAARSIGHLPGIDRSQLVKALKVGLDDQDEAVRATAGGALGRILNSGKADH